MDLTTITKSVLASRLVPLCTWSAAIIVLFLHTGTFRIKPKPIKTTPKQVETAVVRVTPSFTVPQSTPPPPSASAGVFFSLLEKVSLTLPAQARSGAGESNKGQPAPPEPPKMTFVSVRANDGNAELEGEGTGAMIPCRLSGPISNAKDGSRILIHGVVIENITSSSGKILIEAGTQVLGVGQIDSLTGRIKSYGRWSLVTDKHELRAKARLLEYASGREGLRGRETSPEAPELQKQAIVRDGIYLYVPDQADFTLQLLGQFELTDLRPVEPAPEEASNSQP
jgi:hypothetical protein